MNEHHRRPAAFRLDDPKVVVTAEAGRAARGSVRVMVEPEPSLPVVAAPDPPPPRRFAWGTLLWSSLGGLVVLGIGLGVTRLIEDLFGRSEALGWLGVALAGARRARLRGDRAARGGGTVAARQHREAAPARRA